MKSLCIKTNNSNALKYIFNQLKHFETEDICFSINSFKSYKNIIIHYFGNDYTSFLYNMSTLLSLCIIDELENELVKNLISKNYFYFDLNEINEILSNYQNFVLDDFCFLFDKKYNILIDSFFSYFKESNKLILPGFINFRISSYIKILEETISTSVNSYILEKEYIEFVSLLLSYINSKKCNTNLVHLVYQDNQFSLLDEKYLLISLSDDNLNVKFMSDFSFSNNDYILNTLLNLLPKKLVIHIFQDISPTEIIDSNFLTTINQIFENKIEYCKNSNCSICSKKSSSLINKI